MLRVKVPSGRLRGTHRHNLNLKSEEVGSIGVGMDRTALGQQPLWDKISGEQDVVQANTTRAQNDVNVPEKQNSNIHLRALARG